MKYFINLIYYFISFLDSFINVFSSIFGFYPKLDMATSFLVYNELSRVNKEIKERSSYRNKKKVEFEEKVSEAKGILNGED